VRQLAEQIIVVSVEEDNVSLVAPEVAGGAGGVILFGATAPSNLAASLRSLVASTPGGVARFIMTDEEGGVAQRMANLVGSIPSARQMGATMTPGQIRRLAKQLAKRMLGVGVTMDLAPSSTWTEGRGLMTGTPTARGRSVLTRRSPPRMASHSRLAYAKAG
jgi:beta-N-acetylhexosaminidase